MYPLLFSESFRVNNVNISNLSIRNVYQHTSDLRNLSISHPSLFSISVRNLYNRFRQIPERMKINLPTISFLWISNLYNKHRTSEESLKMEYPVITDMYIRNQLQQLLTYPLDETISMGLPTPLDIHHKNVVSKYLEQEIGVFKINTPTDFFLEKKNILNKTSQSGPQLAVNIPSEISFSGTVKPVLTFPVLEGIEERELVSNRLFWDDSSITHTGYTIYKSLEPIPEDTIQEPYIHLGRDVKQFDDSDGIPLNTPVYYRVTPRTVYGNLFSNQVELLHYTTKIITFMMQESPTYIPIRVDDNIIPLVPHVDTMWDELNASFEQMNVLDITIMSEYTPSPTYIEMRIYNE